MDEEVTDETAGGAEGGPTASAGVGVVVGTLSGELGARGAITRSVAHIEVGFDGRGNEFAAIFANEGDVRRLDEILHYAWSLFLGLADARSAIATWVADYNNRPGSNRHWMKVQWQVTIFQQPARDRCEV